MKKFVWDLECNGLKPDTLWCLSIMDIDSKVISSFSDYSPDHGSIKEGLELLATGDILIGHNIIRFDLPVLKSLTDFKPKEGVKIIDTLIMSRLNDFTRVKTNGRHGLDPWGESLGVPKPPVSDWMTWDPHMIHRCQEDCKINEGVYNTVMKEAKVRIEEKPYYRKALQVEHKIAELSNKQINDGWQFNFDECAKLILKITDEMKVIEGTIEPKLKPITSFIDDEEKIPLFKKNGEYTAVSARMIGEYLGYVVTPEDSLSAEPPMVAGTKFQRTKTVPAGLGNQDSVKEYLETIGWKPIEWNWRKIGREFIKTSPKFCEKSLLKVGAEGQMINEYYSLRNRKSVLTSFMEQKDGDGRIRGDVNDMGAKSFRQTHKIIANLPSAGARYGKEIRSLFTCPEDRVIISADGAAYQIRILAHYLKNQAYTDVVLRGDPHQFNADAIGCGRSESKGVFFGVLYGAGATKVANMLGVSMKEGKKARENLIQGIPGLAQLIDKVQCYYAQRKNVGGRGWIPSIDGRKVYAEDAFKCLNYLIQSAEACLMKATLSKIATDFDNAGIDFKQLLFYHDEVSYEIKPSDEEEARHIIAVAFREAPKAYNVEIMEAGDIKTGRNYYEVH